VVQGVDVRDLYHLYPAKNASALAMYASTSPLPSSQGLRHKGLGANGSGFSLRVQNLGLWV